MHAADAEAQLVHANWRATQYEAELGGLRYRAEEAEAHLAAFQQSRLIRLTRAPRELYARTRGMRPFKRS